ncbi:MAG: NUDIX hydrolase [Acidobacteria bacterium]|nr:NUDIX hydrolase [Acidobacteriota bacterium]
MKWHVYGERPIYTSGWVNLSVIDVEVPGHGRIDHHVVRMPAQAAGVVVANEGRVLLMWRHRLVTDTWGWEVPGGRIESGETPEQAARREAIEECGWEPTSIRPLLAYHPSNGLSDQTFHLFESRTARHIGEPSDGCESERLEWFEWSDAMALIDEGKVCDGLSLTALLCADRRRQGG